MNYETIQTKTYTIYKSSTLKAILYLGDDTISPSSIIGPFKYNTSYASQESPIGEVSFSKVGYLGQLHVEYTPSNDYIGIDTFEFIVSYINNYDPSLSRTYKIVMCVNIVEDIKDDISFHRFIEFYLNDENQNALYTKLYPITNDGNIKATKMILSSTDITMEWAYDSFYFDILNLNGDVRNPLTNATAESYVELDEHTAASNGRDIKYLSYANIHLQRPNKEYKKTELYSVTFYDFIDINKDETVLYKEKTHLIMNFTKIKDSVKKQPIPNIPDMEGFDKPDFIIGSVMTPPAQKQDSSTLITPQSSCGNLFESTQPHEEFNAQKSRTIKVGRSVPEHGVNLCYYENKVSSMDDLLSSVEVDTNVVNVAYAQDYMHIRGVYEKDNSLFPDAIPFKGDKGSELEHYTGTLYREYVTWEEDIEKDALNKYIQVYQEYKGLRQTDLDNLSIYFDYKDDEYTGTLEMSHNIIDAIDFYRDKDDYPYPKVYQCFTKFEGLTYKNRIVYNGTAKYGGMVVEDIGLKNFDPDYPQEIIMFPDDNCVLRDEKGNKIIHDDNFLITDKFVDGVPLYYKHRLKQRIYDAIGPDKHGVYNNSSIVVVLEDGTILDDDEYKWLVIVEPTKWNNIYDAYVYTSFVPSFNMNVYVMYDGMPIGEYEEVHLINPANAISGIKERLSVYECMTNDEYFVSKNSGIEKQSTITINGCTIVKDTRGGIDIKFKILADEKYESKSYHCKVINHKYALSSDKYNYINHEQIVSTKTSVGFASAREMFLQGVSDEIQKKITPYSTFRIRYDISDKTTLYDKDKVVMYTHPFGNDVVLAHTFEDTGFPNEADYNKLTGKLPHYHIYKEQNGLIYKGYSVKCKSVSPITIHPPQAKHQLKHWYPAINFAYYVKEYDRIDSTIKIVYTIPEYYSQVFGEDGPPYCSIKDEKAEIISNHLIKTHKYPLRIKHDFGLWQPSSIRVRKFVSSDNIKELSINAFDYERGIIEIKESLSPQDTILIDYEYEEKFYHYPGYYDDGNVNTQMIDLNLNPSMYSTYLSTLGNIFKRESVYNLFNKKIYLFLKPARVIDYSQGLVLEENRFTLYHTIDNPNPIGNFDLNIGIFFIRHHTSLKATDIVDSRVRGGGVIESMKGDLRRALEPESDFYLDIGTMDGAPYHENSVVIIKIDEKVLSKNGGAFSEEDVKEAVNKWIACGGYPIIKFVPTIASDEMPINTMSVTSSVDNVINYRPVISCEVIEM